MKKIKIRNPDAVHREIEFEVSEHAARSVVEWYESHCTGDRYRIWVDGEEV